MSLASRVSTLATAVGTKLRTLFADTVTMSDVLIPNEGFTISRFVASRAGKIVTLSFRVSGALTANQRSGIAQIKPGWIPIDRGGGITLSTEQDNALTGSAAVARSTGGQGAITVSSPRTTCDVIITYASE